MAGVNKEIWIDTIKEGYYPDGSFIMESIDMSDLVTFNTINLAEAGSDPEVLINNNVFPVPFTQRTDLPIQLPLDTHDTKGTWVKKIEETESAYGKMDSVVRGHRNALYETEVRRAAFNWAPAGNTVDTPVLAATGALVGGRRLLTFDDIVKLKVAYDKKDVPGDRILVICPDHQGDLLNQDRQLFNQIMGKPGNLFYGFKVYTTSRTALYNGTTLAKKAYGAASAGTDAIASFAFTKQEVMRCEGTINMFYRLNDPEYKGDIVNFQKRFLALPIRAKGQGAIVSVLS
jgi:hypothetical protein